MLHLTNPAIRRDLGLTLKELAAEDWRKLLAAGRESLTQAPGRAVAASGLLARSAHVKRGVNVIVFPGLRAADRLQVVEGDKLDAMGARAKVCEGIPPSPKQEKALVEMDRLLDGLSRVMKPADIGHWLKTPNPAFDGSTPLQAVERGEIDRIWRMLYELESGQPG